MFAIYWIPNFCDDIMTVFSLEIQRSFLKKYCKEYTVFTIGIINYCTVFHINNYKSTFSPPCILKIIQVLSVLFFSTYNKKPQIQKCLWRKLVDIFALT